MQSLEGHVGVDGVGTVTDEGGEVMDFAGFTSFEDDGDLGAGSGFHQVMVEATHGEQGRHGGHVRGDLAIGDDEQVGTVGDGLVGSHAEHLKGVGEAFATAISGEDGVQGGGLEAVEVDFAQLGEFLVVNQRIAEADHAAALRTGVEQVAFGAEEGLGRSDEFLTNAVQGWVGDLGEDLFEVLVEKLGLLGEHGEGSVVAHRGDGLHAGAGGGAKQHAQILVSVTEGQLALEDAVLFDGGGVLGFGKVAKHHAVVG